MAKKNENKVERVTKKDLYNILLSMEAVQEREDLVKFIKREIELLDRKNAKKSGKVNEVTERVKAAILDYMEVGKEYTATQLAFGVQSNFADTITNQRVSPIMTKLEQEGVVTKTTKKGKTLFSYVETVAEEA